MEGILVPISMFAGITVVLSLVFWLRYRNRRDMQQTVRMALDKGQELSPELIDRLGQPKAPKDKVLRRAVIWLALAIALVLCGIFVPDPSGYALKGIWAGAAFPLCIGIGYLILWLFTDRNQ